MDTKLLRQKILDLAIHGKLVPQDPADEPASVLLERIKAEKEKLIKNGEIKKSAKTSDTPHYENMPFEVPNGWIWCNITDVVTKITDGTHNSPKNYPNGKYMYVTAKNIKHFGVSLEDITYVDDKTHHEIYSRCNPEKEDILYIKDGATTGVVAINQLDEPFSMLSSVALIKPSKLLSNKYLCNYLQSSYCYNDVRKSMKGVGITRITLKQIEKWNIPLPPLSEQHRIVAEIEKWFSLIDSIESSKNDLQSTIKQTKSKILDLAIHGKLVPQNPKDEPAIELLKRINPKAEISCDNGKNEQLPQGWSLTQMGSLCNLIDGDRQKIERINLDVKFLRGEKEGKLLKEGRFVSADSLLILVDGENSGEVFKTSIDGYQGSTFKILSINDKMNEDYILQIIRMKQKNLRESKVGSAIPHLNKKLFREMLVPVPSFREQSRIVAKIEELFAVIDNIQKSLEA